MAKANAIVSVCMTPDEKAVLKAEADEQGISVSTLIWQRTFNTTAVRVRGRHGGTSKAEAEDEIPGFQMTG